MCKQIYGVVLWSDRVQHSAVVWCEDQGDLAFLGPDAHSAEGPGDLDEGDLILFECVTHNRQRRVENARCVVRAAAPGLADELMGAISPTPPAEPAAGAEILIFPGRRRAPERRSA